MKGLKRFAILIAATASGTLLGDARVNLWPVYGQEDGAYDFLWPLVHIEPARDVAHVFNVDWGQGHFYTHPFFYLTKKSMTLPPFHADRDLHDGFLFPLFWWNQATSFHALFPLYGYHGSSDCFWALGGLVGAKGQEGKRDTWAFPLYFSRGWERFYSLPYSYVHDGRTSTRVFLGGLAGTSHADDDTLRGTWLFPLAFWRPGGFFSLPYSGYDDHGRTRHLIAGGLGGWRADTSWLFPLYYADAEKFISLPLSFDDECVISPLYAYIHKDARTTHCLPWALTWYTDKTNNVSWCSLPLLSSYEGGKGHAWKADVLCPLLHAQTDASGRLTGHRFLPLWSYCEDVRYGMLAQAIDAPQLPEAVIDREAGVKTTEKSATEFLKQSAELSVLGVLDLSFAHTKSTLRALHDRARNTYQVIREERTTSLVAYERKEKRTVTFDASTHARTNDVVTAKTSVIDDLLYESHEARDLRSGLHETHAALFYKVWERHEKNDHVSVNVFPFFTYDAGEKGPSGCSFLWRFFRYETEAGQNPKIDLLFIPLCR